MFTPCIGILMETGKWPIAERIQYSTLMFHHSIINSKERLVTDVILEQEDKHHQNTFYHKVLSIGKELRIDTGKNFAKSE